MKLTQLLTGNVTSSQTSQGLQEETSTSFMFHEADMELAKQYVEKLFKTSGKFVYGVDDQGVVTVDCTGNLTVNTMTMSGSDLFYGDANRKDPIGFRVKFGRVNGNFECDWYVTGGMTLENGPTEVDGYVHLSFCNLVTTKYLPKKINGSLTIDGNGKLTSLDFIPEGIHGFYANECLGLRTINGKFNDLEDYDLQISDSPKLTSLDFVPDSIGGDLYLSGKFTGAQITELFGRLKRVGYSDTGEIRFMPSFSTVSGHYNVSRLPMINNLHQVVLPNGGDHGQRVELTAIINDTLSDIVDNAMPRRKATMLMQRKLLDANLEDFLK